MNNDDDEIMTPDEWAARIKCSPKSLEKQRQHGSGCPYVKLGRLVRYRKADTERYLQQRTRRSTSDEDASS